MTNKVKRRYPAYFSGFEETIHEFSTLEEFLNIEFIKDISQIERFYRFSKANTTLMAEFNEGKSWYAIGYLENPSIDLPEWSPVY